MATFTTEMNLEKPSEGANNAGESLNDNMDLIDAGRTYKFTIETGHGGSKGEWYYMNASGKAEKAKADAAATSLIKGILTEDGAAAAQRYFRYNGKLEKTGWGLTPNTLYYLSAATAGAMTTVKPSAPNIVVELGQSDSTGDILYIQYKAYLETTPGSQPVFKTINGDTGSAVADQADDTLIISGGNGVVTSVPAEDDLRITLTTLTTDWDAGSAGKIIVETFQVDHIQEKTGTHGIVIDNDVGIGISPNQLLEVFSAANQGARIRISSTYVSAGWVGLELYGVGGDAGVFAGGLFKNQVDESIAIWNQNSDGFTLHPTLPWIGVGNAIPDRMLHLYSTSGSAIIRMERDDTTIVDGDVYGIIEWEGQDASASSAGVRATIQVEGAGNNGETEMVLSTAGLGAAGLIEGIRILSSGKVTFAVGYSGDLLVENTGASDGGLIELGNSDVIVTAAEVIGQLDWRSNDASGGMAGIVGRIKLFAEADFTGGQAKTSMGFHTNTGVAGSLAEVIRLTSTGVVLLNHIGELAGAHNVVCDDIFHVLLGASGATPFGTASMILESNTGRFMQFLTPNTQVSGIMFGDPEAAFAGYIRYSHVDDTMKLYAGSTATISIAANAVTLIGSLSMAAYNITANDLLSINTITFDAEVGDKISMLDNRLNATNMYGFGAEVSYTYYKAPLGHRWYINANADAGVSDKMQLDSTNLDLNVILRVNHLAELAGAHNIVFDNIAQFDAEINLGSFSDSNDNLMTIATASGFASGIKCEELDKYGAIFKYNGTDNMLGIYKLNNDVETPGFTIARASTTGTVANIYGILNIFNGVGTQISQYGTAAGHPYWRLYNDAGDTIVNLINSNGDSYFNGGNIGVGTPTPSEKFEVKTANAAYGIIHSSATGAIFGTYVDTFAGYMGTRNDYDLRFFTNNGAAVIAIRKTTGNFEVRGGILLANHFAEYTAAHGIQFDNNLELAVNEILNCGGLEMFAGAKITSTSFLHLETAAGGSIYLDFGGTLFFRDQDNADFQVLSINSTNGGMQWTNDGQLSSLVGSLIFKSASAQPQYFDAGTLFTWRDIDAALAIRMTLDSATGILAVDHTAELTALHGNVFDNKIIIGTGTKHDGFLVEEPAEVQTTDATPTTLTSFTLLDENTYQVQAYIVGVKSDGSERAGYFITGTVYRTGAGNATIEGQTSLHEAESDSNWDATFTVNGNDIRVTVTGVAATTIEWGCTITYMNMSN